MFTMNANFPGIKPKAIAPAGGRRPVEGITFKNLIINGGRKKHSGQKTFIIGGKGGGAVFK